jgi:hypothetical protein
MALALLSAAAMLGIAEAATGMLGVVQTFSRYSMDEEAPEWCKNETELTWQQRKERMQQHTTLQWAKRQAAKLRDDKQTIPEWMDKIVTDDENRGRLKWAVSEFKRLKAEGKEAPEWMLALVKEDERWGNRWAACKAHELKAQNLEVPAWMLDNARKGIMEYASEKAAEIQEQIQEMEAQKERDDAVVQASGDIQDANHRLLWRARQDARMTCASQLTVLENEMERFHEAEEKAKEGTIKFPALRQAGMAAQDATSRMSMLLERKLAMIQSGIDAGLA